MTPTLSLILIGLISYLIGSISFAVLVSKLLKLSDPRTYGSGNPGATNVLRSGNKKAAVFTLLGDALKGSLAVWIARVVAANTSVYLGADSAWALQAIAIASLMVFLGHLYPIFHQFRGGKGVATAAGVLCMIHPYLGVATLLSWLAIAIFFRYSSAAALAAAIFAPFYYALLFGVNIVALAIVLIGLLLIWRHRQNIRNLLNGTESRLKF